MYLDIDVHHGDAVEEAFLTTDRVLTLSMHHSSLGYFPGSGAYNGSTINSTMNNNSISNSGIGGGEGFALNLPLKEGLKDALFIAAFQKLCSSTIELYRPDCIVLCCGVDGLAHDPIGRAWNLTPAAYGAVTAQVRAYGLPVLLLGGGGYDSSASCCAFAAALAGITGQSLPEDVPQHQYFDKYGPSYSLLHPGRPSLAPDLNTEGEVEAMCDGLLSVLRSALERKHELERQKTVAHETSNTVGGGRVGVGGAQAKRIKLAAHR